MSTDNLGLGQLANWTATVIALLTAAFSIGVRSNQIKDNERRVTELSQLIKQAAQQEAANGEAIARLDERTERILSAIERIERKVG